MPHRQPPHEKTSETVASVTERVAKIYQSLHALKYSSTPPIYTAAEQKTTRELVYHALSGNTSLHMGPASDKNTPESLMKWRTGVQANFVLWFNRHQRGRIVTTPYYLGTTTGDIVQPFIATPKDAKRFHSLEPSEGGESRRWPNFVKIVEAVEELDLPKPSEQSDVELTA